MKKLNRGWVKNAAIIFLVIMLLLTFFSNTIMNYSLPEVVVGTPTSGTITEKIRGSATAQANSTYSVEVDSVREILAVYVKDGDEVKVGDKLFELEEAEDDALSLAVASLNEKRLAYQQALIDLANSDFAQNNEAVRQAREALQRAINERSALGTTNTTLTGAQARVTTATNTYNTLKSQLDALETELEYIDNYSNRSSRIATEVIAYETAQAKVAGIEAQMGMSYSDYLQAISSLEEELAGLRQELADLQAAGADSGQISAKQSAITAVETELNAYYTRSSTMSQLNAELTTAKSALSTADSAMKTAAASARTAVVGEINALSPQVTAAAAAVTEAENARDAVEAITTAELSVTSAQNELNSALISLSSAQQAASVEDSKALLDIQAMEEEIAELEEKIEKLESGTEDGGTTILSKHDGIISGLTAVAGKTTAPGEALANILVEGMGYTAEIVVPASQVSQITPGATADVTSNNWSANITGRVSGFKSDPDNPSTQKIAVVELDGDVTAGEQLTIAIHISSAKYDTIVPLSAVGTDTNGRYVYVLQQKSSPLGTRYIASRVEVSVLAEDDTQCAISGALDNYSSVITRISSGVSISDRDYVRLTEG